MRLLLLLLLQVRRHFSVMAHCTVVVQIAHDDGERSNAVLIFYEKFVI
jgi:hypothetical protein